MIRFAIVGAGWRSEFFLRVAAALPDQFEVAAVVSGNADRAARIAKLFNVAIVASADELNVDQLDFVVTSVPRKVNAEIITRLVERGVAVLSETPPAETVEQMAQLCALVEEGAKIQVAEQYIQQPLHAARMALIESGKLGRIQQAQVSVAHGYHGISLIRRFLGVGFEDALIRGQRFTGRGVQGPGRSGPAPEQKVVDEVQTICTLDFGDRLGVFDFTGPQYFSPIRGQRVCIRGEHGEIINHDATLLTDFESPVRGRFHRHSAGPEGNLEGHYLKGIQFFEKMLYANPLAPARLSDDEIAVGTCMLKMGQYIQGGPAFYSLQEACQDHYIAMLCDEAATTGRPVQTTRQLWAE